MNTCLHCGSGNVHYATHICPDCTCYWYWERDPSEPHIPALPVLEKHDPECPACGTEW